jgi:hypothetical protein
LQRRIGNDALQRRDFRIFPCRDRAARHQARDECLSGLGR